MYLIVIESLNFTKNEFGSLVGKTQNLSTNLEGPNSSTGKSILQFFIPLVNMIADLNYVECIFILSEIYPK